MTRTARSCCAFLLATIFLSGPASAQSNAKTPLVAVFAVEDSTGTLNTEQREQFANYLANRLAESTVFRVLPNAEIRRRLRQEKLESYKACYDQRCQIDIGRELAANMSASAAVTKLGPVCLVTSVLYDLRRAASEGGASAEASCNESALLLALKTVAQKLISQRRASIEAVREEAARAARQRREDERRAALRKRQQEQSSEAVRRHRRELELFHAAVVEAQRSRRRKTMWGYASLALSGAALVTAGVLYGVGFSQRSDAEDQYAASNTQDEMDRHWADVEAGDRKLIGGHVLAGVGGVVLGIALYELFTRPRIPKRSPAPASFGVMPLADIRGLGVLHRF